MNSSTIENPGYLILLGYFGDSDSFNLISLSVLFLISVIFLRYYTSQHNFPVIYRKLESLGQPQQAPQEPQDTYDVILKLNDIESVICEDRNNNNNNIIIINNNDNKDNANENENDNTNNDIIINNDDNYKEQDINNNNNNLPKRGWGFEISSRYENQKLDEIFFFGTIVAVLGLYDRGKTFLLSHLTNMNLPSGKSIRTEGISFKIIESEEGGKRATVADTAGLHSPIKMYTDVNPTETLRKKKMTEFFLNDLLFEISDVFIIVVNDLTVPDQEFISRFVAKLEKTKDRYKKKTLYIVHNFRDVTSLKEANIVWEKQVVESYMSGEKQPVEMSNKTKVQTLGTKATRHVFLIRHEGEENISYNKSVIQLLKQWIFSDYPFERVPISPLKFIEERAGALLGNYLTNVGELAYDQSLKAFVAKPCKEGEICQLKNLSIDLASGLLFSAFESENQPLYDMFIVTAQNEDKTPRENKPTKRLVIYVDIASLGKDNVKVTILPNDRQLKIVGERKSPTWEPNETAEKVIDRCSRKYGNFTLVIQIPEGFDVRSTKNCSENPGELKFVAYAFQSEEIV